MRISARNQLKGKVVEVTKGQTTAHVRIDVNGIIVTAAITNEAVDELGLKVGQDAYAVVKASDVMVAVDHMDFAHRPPGPCARSVASPRLRLDHTRVVQALGHVRLHLWSNLPG